MTHRKNRMREAYHTYVHELAGECVLHVEHLLGVGRLVLRLLHKPKCTKTHTQCEFAVLMG